MAMISSNNSEVVGINAVPELSVNSSIFEPEAAVPQQALRQLIVVSCYTRFDNLAHGPRGTEARRSLYTFRMDPNDGQMLMLSVSSDVAMNPAFSRFHPTKNVLYTCTE